jgi:hypothetical protein
LAGAPGIGAFTSWEKAAGIAVQKASVRNMEFLMVRILYDQWMVE